MKIVFLILYANIVLTYKNSSVELRFIGKFNFERGIYCTCYNTISQATDNVTYK